MRAGSVGGYVASSVELIEHMKTVSASSSMATSMSPACAAQCIHALNPLPRPPPMEADMQTERVVREKLLEHTKALQIEHVAH